MVARPKNIVVLGAGFAGLHVVQELARHALPKEYCVILVDQNDYHLYTPDLYEVATSFTPDWNAKHVTQMSGTVATSLTSLVPDSVEFIQAKVLSIDPKKKTLRLEGRRRHLPYHYLVISLGSVVNFFDIPGMKKYAHTLKTLPECLRLNGALHSLISSSAKKSPRPMLSITVGGGGATGVETAAELSGALDQLCELYGFLRERVVIRLIEGGPRLVSLPKKDTVDIMNRFRSLGIQVYLRSRITGVMKKKIKVCSADEATQTYPSDLMIWTGGVQVNPLASQAFGSTELRGSIPVNEHLQVKGFKTVFAAGDNAYFESPIFEGKRVPMLAQLAYGQGKMVAKNIVSQINQRPLKMYRPKPTVLVVPIGGQYSVFRFGRFVFKGRLYWFFKRFVALKYLRSILPPVKAFKQWVIGNRLFRKNDV